MNGIFGPAVRRTSWWSRFVEARRLRRRARVPTEAELSDVLNEEPRVALSWEQARVAAEAKETIALLDAAEARGLRRLARRLARRKPALERFRRARIEADSDHTTTVQERDAYLRGFPKGRADRRLGRGSWRRLSVLVLYSAASVIELVAYRSALLVLNPTEWESWLLAGLSLGPIVAAKMLGSAIRRIRRRIGTPEASPVPVTSWTWIGLGGLATLLIVSHYALAYVRQVAVPTSSAAGLIPFGVFMVLTGSAAVITAYASYVWTNPDQDKLDELDRRVSRTHRSARSRARHESGAEGRYGKVWETMRWRQAWFMSLKEAATFRGEASVLTIASANPTLHGIRSSDTISIRSKEIQPAVSDWHRFGLGDQSVEPEHNGQLTLTGLADHNGHRQVIGK